MSASTFLAFAKGCAQHCLSHNTRRINIILHGGEPLLVNNELLMYYGEVIETEIIGKGIDVQVSVQSNGLLFTPEIGQLFRRFGWRLGLSLDGDFTTGNRERVDHKGRVPKQQLAACVNLITTQFPDVLSGVLAVIDLRNDPVKTAKFLLGLNAPGLDLLLPHLNHTNCDLSTGRRYGEWLISFFDEWVYSENDTGVRYFESIMNLLLGQEALVDTIGPGSARAVTVETNGGLELQDTMKSTYPGATATNASVLDHGFQELSAHEAFGWYEQMVDAHCDDCKACPHVNVCSGGYLPHRYATENGFDNPSVFCLGIFNLIEHIKAFLQRELKNKPLVHRFLA